jgi:hypothetical protein
MKVISLATKINMEEYKNAKITNRTNSSNYCSLNN